MSTLKVHSIFQDVPLIFSGAGLVAHEDGPVLHAPPTVGRLVSTRNVVAPIRGLKKRDRRCLWPVVRGLSTRRRVTIGTGPILDVTCKPHRPAKPHQYLHGSNHMWCPTLPLCAVLPLRCGMERGESGTERLTWGRPSERPRGLGRCSVPPVCQAGNKQTVPGHCKHSGGKHHSKCCNREAEARETWPGERGHTHVHNPT